LLETQQEARIVYGYARNLRLCYSMEQILKAKQQAGLVLQQKLIAFRGFESIVIPLDN
jgi:hypothetical protein